MNSSKLGALLISVVALASISTANNALAEEVDGKEFCSQVTSFTQNAVEQIGRKYEVSVSSVRILSKGWFSTNSFSCLIKFDTPKGPHECGFSVYKTDDGEYLGHRLKDWTC